MPRHQFLVPEQFDSSSYDREAAWLAVGDWGSPSEELRDLSAAMAEVAQTHIPRPDVILALGDNFYPNGIESPHDWDTWRCFFPLAHPNVFGVIPWRAVMGNHDYLGADPLEQMNFSNRNAKPQDPRADDKYRYDHLWQMRGDSSTALGFPSRSSTYSFSIPHGSSIESCFVPDCSDYYLPSWANKQDEIETRGQGPIDVTAEGAAVPRIPLNHEGTGSVAKKYPQCAAHFVAFDTNASQFIVRNKFPNVLRDFGTQVKWLRQQLLSNDDTHEEDGTWRIFLCHQAFYTNGKGHENEARCLRYPQKKYPRVGDGTLFDGLQLEPQLAACRFDAVFCGHEHVMQWTYPKTEILHLCCGASIETGYYKGRHDECGPSLSDFPDGKYIDDIPETYGFASGEVYRKKDGSSTVLRCCFWGHRVGQRSLKPVLLKEILLQKSVPRK